MEKKILSNEHEGEKTLGRKEIEQEFSQLKKNIIQGKEDDDTLSQLSEKVKSIESSNQSKNTGKKLKKLSNEINILNNLKHEERKEFLKDMQQIITSQDATGRGEIIAKVLDGPIPLDPLLGLIEGFGDIGVGTLSTVYYMAEVKKAGGSTWDFLKIGLYQGIDTVVGSIPIVGSVFDFFFKSNKMSAKVLKNIKNKKMEEFKTKNNLTDEQYASLINENKTLNTINKTVTVVNKIAGSKKITPTTPQSSTQAA